MAFRASDRVIAGFRRSCPCCSGSHAHGGSYTSCGEVGKVIEQCYILAVLSIVPPGGISLMRLDLFDVPWHHLAIYVAVCLLMAGSGRRCTKRYYVMFIKLHLLF